MIKLIIFKRFPWLIYPLEQVKRQKWQINTLRLHFFDFKGDPPKDKISEIRPLDNFWWFVWVGYQVGFDFKKKITRYALNIARRGQKMLTSALFLCTDFSKTAWNFDLKFETQIPLNEPEVPWWKIIIKQIIFN